MLIPRENPLFGTFWHMSPCRFEQNKELRLLQVQEMHHRADSHQNGCIQPAHWICIIRESYILSQRHINRVSKKHIDRMRSSIPGKESGVYNCDALPVYGVYLGCKGQAVLFYIDGIGF